MRCFSKSCISFFLIAIIITPATAQEGKLAPYTLPGTQARIFESELIKDSFELTIFLPPGHGRNTPEHGYPVLYLLDTNVYFGVCSAIRQMQVMSELPGFVVIGIGYSGANQRNRDYTPIPDSRYEGSGGAAEFLQFLQRELFPTIEPEYKIDGSQRALFGHAFGGLFGMYVLFTQPELFNRYILISPSLVYADQQIFRIEEKYFADRKRLPATVYTAVGALELSDRMVKPWEDFIKIVESRHYRQLNLTSAILPDETHFSGGVVGLLKGLRRIFAASIRLE